MDKLDKICVALGISPDQLLSFDEKFIFENCTNNGVGKDIIVNQFPEELLNQYNEQIKQLKEEVVFLRSIVKKEL